MGRRDGEREKGGRVEGEGNGEKEGERSKLNCSRKEERKQHSSKQNVSRRKKKVCYGIT